MKEVTYEDWQKNPTPRMMWVWDNPKKKLKLKVIYIMDSGFYSVITLNNVWTVHYKHCAEIEEPKKRRMTNQELAWWLRDGKNREWSFVNENPKIYSIFEYYDNNKNSSVGSDILIRENGGEWREPIIIE